jgi:hypothetical protein
MLLAQRSAPTQSLVSAVSSVRHLQNLAHLSLALPAPLTDAQIADIAKLQHLEIAGIALEDHLNVQAERALHATNLRQAKPATKAQESTEVAKEEPAANVFRARWVIA